jgi:hypothetical protein
VRERESKEGKEKGKNKQVKKTTINSKLSRH